VSYIDELVKAYTEIVELPWDSAISGAEKVWFVIYDPTQERRLRLHLPEFETATRRSNHRWKVIDITNAFAEWMAAHDYFEAPDLLDLALEDFANDLAALIADGLTTPDADAETVVALLGVASLFGLNHVSSLLERVRARIRGRLLVFFPGQHAGSNYRLLDARDGWDYLAVAITAKNT
jgi:hypothetical protein